MKGSSHYRVKVFKLKIKDISGDPEVQELERTKTRISKPQIF